MSWLEAYRCGARVDDTLPVMSNGAEQPDPNPEGGERDSSADAEAEAWSAIVRRGRRVVAVHSEPWQDDPAHPIAMSDAQFLIEPKPDERGASTAA